MLLRPYLPLAALALAACSSPEEVADRAGVDAHASADGSSARASAVTAGKAKSVKEETDQYSFSYIYPAQAGAIPQLAMLLDSEAEKAVAELVETAQDASVDAKTNGFPFHPHSFSQEWKVIADLPGYLSLSGEFATYSGGAHGMYGMESFVWDKDAGRRIESIALFRSSSALNRALGDKLCAALNRERAERRGEPVAADSDDMFDQCVGVEEATLLLGSSNGRTFDRLGVWIGPYVAGPYAEGSFELDFPVDAAVLRAVNPEYRTVFSARR